MDDQTVTASTNGDQSVGTVRATLMLIALVVEIVIHSVAAMYAHTSPALHMGRIQAVLPRL
jgi:hypothetical protein